MRTTVTLDPDTVQLLRRTAAARRQSLKRVLNDSIRRGLSADVSNAAKEAESGDEALPTFSSAYAAGVARGGANRLADEMELEAELARKGQRA
jgi:hypothetical protein